MEHHRIAFFEFSLWLIPVGSPDVVIKSWRWQKILFFKHFVNIILFKTNIRKSINILRLTQKHHAYKKKVYCILVWAYSIFYEQSVLHTLWAYSILYEQSILHTKYAGMSISVELVKDVDQCRIWLVTK